MYNESSPSIYAETREEIDEVIKLRLCLAIPRTTKSEVRKKVKKKKVYRYYKIRDGF